MFSALMAIGWVWTFELQVVLTETPAVQSILSSLLTGIILLVSVVVSINSELLPESWVFGLPPLMSFVSSVFTIALVPFLVLTSYMLRLSTVAQRTAGGGPFSLQ